MKKSTFQGGGEFEESQGVGLLLLCRWQVTSDEIMGEAEYR